jgi:hypothetical protein
MLLAHGAPRAVVYPVFAEMVRRGVQRGFADLGHRAASNSVVGAVVYRSAAARRAFWPNKSAVA